MRATLSLILLSTLGLAACSEKANNSNVDAYNSKIASHSNPFINELNANTATQLNAKPVEGIATMTGSFQLQTPAGMTGIDKIAGQIDLSADFAAETITGTMYQFVETYTDNTATSISGSANYAGSIKFDPASSDPTATGTGTGHFTTTGNQRYSMSTNVNGEFYRRAGGELASAGLMSARASSGGATHGLVGTYHATE